MAKDKTIYTEDSLQKLDPSNIKFPPPHEPVYIINSKNRKERYYEAGWVLGNYGVTFLKEIPQKNKKRWAEFMCPLCGKTFESRIDLINGGQVKSCGCRKTLTSTINAYIMGKNNIWSGKDISGQKFGSLIALYPTEKREKSSGGVYWLCQCDCGGTRLATTYSLESGHVKYCPECMAYRQALSHVGKRFGKLVITEIAKEGRASNNGLLCFAECDCGNIIKIPISFILRKNGQQSCGRCVVSKGENKVKKTLEDMGVYFLQQENFDKTFKRPDTTRCCFADFYLPNQNIVIEYNGEQHYHPVEYFGGEQGFIKLKDRDRWKKQFYYNHNLKLIVIPYTDYENISVEYLIQRGVIYES